MTGTMHAGIDWDDAFEHSAYSPGSEDLPPVWARSAELARNQLSSKGRARRAIAYGPDPREALDLFAPEGPPHGTVVFVHGGYWHKLDRSYWSHLAAGCLAHGWAVAIPSYPLAPDVRIADITQSIRSVVEWIAADQNGPIRLVGHSAGGHLVSRMMCAGVLPSAVAARLARVVSISGVHHLPPLLLTRMNATLRLTEAEALSESPISHAPLPDVPVTCWTGANERPEFLRQTRMAAEVWNMKGACVDTVFDTGHDHFSVIAALEDSSSPLTQEVLR